MFKKTLAMTILGLFTPQLSAPAMAADIQDVNVPKGKRR